MATSNLTAESAQYATVNDVSRNGRLFKNWYNLDKQFSPWLALYKDIADYIAPGRGRFLDRDGEANQRTKAAAKLLNPVAADALHMMGAGLHGGLSSPARPWFQLSFSDPGLDKYSAGKAWLDDCEKILYGVFKRSNFYTVIHSIYEEVGAFATGALFIDGHPKNIVNFSFLTAGDYRIAINDLSRCHCMYRKFRMQIHQMAAMFGADKLSDTCRRLLDSNPYEWRDVLHVIENNDEYNPNSMAATNMPFRSSYVEWKEQDKRLGDSGYMEMPIVTPRWQALANEAYGWGPGPETLSLSKALQRMELNAMLVEDKYLDPPLAVSADFKDRMVDLSPGAKSTFTGSVDDIGKAFTKLVEIDPRAIEIYENKINNVENKIRRLFYNELFLMIANEDRRMTATEVAARNEEKMIMIGPVIERLLYELLDPCIERVFNLCARAGMMPPPPPDITDAEYKVEYVSILAQAQKLVNSQSMQAYLATAERVAAFEPGSISKTNWDQFLESYGDTVNLPARIVREDDEVAEIRQQQAEAAQAEQEILQDQANADTLQKLGNTPTGEDTALSDLKKTMGAA